MGRNVKSWLQVGVSKETKEVFDLIARRSPQQSTSALILSLIDNEIHRVVKFDKEVQELMIEQECERMEERSDGAITWLNSEGDECGCP